MVTAISTVLVTRVPLELDVIRARGQLFQEVPGGFIQNVYTLRVINMDKTDHEFAISVSGLPGYRIVPATPVAVRAGEIEDVSVNLLVSPDQLDTVNTTISFHVESTDAVIQADSKSTFIGPRPLE